MLLCCCRHVDMLCSSSLSCRFLALLSSCCGRCVDLSSCLRACLSLGIGLSLTKTAGDGCTGHPCNRKLTITLGGSPPSCSKSSLCQRGFSHVDLQTSQRKALSASTNSCFSRALFLVHLTANTFVRTLHRRSLQYTFSMRYCVAPNMHKQSTNNHQPSKKKKDKKKKTTKKITEIKKSRKHQKTKTNRKIQESNKNIKKYTSLRLALRRDAPDPSH